MDETRPTIEEAAHRFREQFLHAPWLVAVGIGPKDEQGNPILVVYTKGRWSKKCPSEWEGFKVRNTKSGPFRLC